MKKTAAMLILFLFALVLWNVFAGSGNNVFTIDGDDVGGPLGALLALVVAGGGLLLAGCIVMLVFGLLGVVFAGVGVLCLGGLALGAALAALLVAPFLLPLLAPLAIIWYLLARSRKQRIVQQAV